jgi:hypothetical protein
LKLNPDATVAVTPPASILFISQLVTDPHYTLHPANRRVRGIQGKLH